MGLINRKKQAKRISTRMRKNNIYRVFFLLATSFSFIVLGILLYRIIVQGYSYLSWDFLANFASRRPENSGIKAAFMGTIWVLVITAPISMLLGVGCALYLEMYARKNKLTQLIQINISNLAGVPSIVFGLLGLTVFVRLFEMGRSVLAGGLTMSLLILPVIVVAAQEAIRAVPSDIQEASYAMGATKWQTIRRVVLPSAIPGIMTGSILALSRTIGETAPLIMIGALTFVAFTPENIWSGFTVMPIQIYNWTSRPQSEFHDVAAAGIIVLLMMLLIMNALAIFIRNKFSKR